MAYPFEKSLGRRKSDLRHKVSLRTNVRDSPPPPIRYLRYYPHIFLLGQERHSFVCGSVRAGAISDWLLEMATVTRLLEPGRTR
jgi:hypothetical protein